MQQYVIYATKEQTIKALELGVNNREKLMNHTNAALFIRFGELPKNSKSAIWKGEECIGYEEGVSVYEAYKNSKGIYTPVLPMPKTNTTFDSYSYYLNHFRGHQYLVEGNIIGYGSDGEPLLKNVVIKETLK